MKTKKTRLIGLGLHCDKKNLKILLIAAFAIVVLFSCGQSPSDQRSYPSAKEEVTQLKTAENPVDVVQRQLDAYNTRDIDAFIATYSKDIKIYNENGELTMEGHDQMRERYGKMFESVTNLFCEIENRIVINNKVIDKEKVRYKESTLHAVAIYEVTDGKISKVNFVK